MATTSAPRTSLVRGLAGPRKLSCLLARSGPQPVEVVVVAILLLALGAAVFGSHILNGGFYYDDWANSARTHFPGGVVETLSAYWNLTSNRPVLVLYIPLTHWLFGQHMGLHLAWAVTLAAAMSTVLFLVLRMLRLPPLHAG